MADDKTKKPLVVSPEAEEEFEEKMEEIEVKKREELAAQRAAKLGVPYVNLKSFPISPEALELIDQKEAEKLKVICFLYTGPEIRIGAVNPENPEIKELAFQLQEKHHSNTVIYQISKHSFQHAFKLYETIPKPRKIETGVTISEEEFNKFKKEIKTFQELDEKLKDASLTEIITMIIAAAVQTGSSDIHIEAEEKDVKVRFRIDGVLQDVATLPRSAWKQMVSRVKLLAKLKLNITDKPQDGRFTIFLKDEKIDVRVSTLPTSYGESIVMRLLMSSAVSLEFKDLGLREPSYSQLKREVERPNGMIITTGPTGSGKTTTLYAILRKLNKPGVKIITLEDPIEYRLEGINQSQVDKSKDYTFAKGLKSILRQDPDIVMVGEIRDLETADIAINAALTGHLVISTIHTNSASGAIPRFLAMKVKPFLLAPALNSIIGQRLVRKICPHCKEEIKLEKEKLERAKEMLSKIPEKSGVKPDLENMKFYKGKGCKKCNHLGYRGRIGIFEVMVMNEAIEKMVLSGKVSEYDMQKIAVEQGMITMVQDGLIKALDGITSVEEVFRVIE